MRIALPVAFTLIFAICPAVTGLDVTARLLDAKEGSWIRNNRSDSYSYTYYVSAVTDASVSIQIIHEHRHHILSNKIVHIPKQYIQEKGIKLDSFGAQPDTIDVNGERYQVTRVHIDENGEGTNYYFWEKQPVTGILRKDEHPESGPSRVTTTYQHHGFEPDEIIRKAGAPREANDEFGIPKGE